MTALSTTKKKNFFFGQTLKQIKVTGLLLLFLLLPLSQHTARFSPSLLAPTPRNSKQQIGTRNLFQFQFQLRATAAVCAYIHTYTNLYIYMNLDIYICIYVYVSLCACSCFRLSLLPSFLRAYLYLRLCCLKFRCVLPRKTFYPSVMHTISYAA